MHSKSFIAVAAVVALLLVLAGGVYAYDNGRSDRIAEGVTVSGVDVGGLDRVAAAQKLRHELLEPLERPVVVRHRKREFTLTPQTAKVGIDVDGSVDAAVRASRDGNLLTRTFRGLTGGEVDEDVEVEISYSRRAVNKLVERVAGKIERDPVDASLNLESGDFTPRPSRDGVRIKASRLRHDVVEQLTSTTADHEVELRTAVVEPEVATAELAERYPSIIRVDRGSFTLTLYEDLKVAKTYNIAVGQVGMDTPAGLYSIQNKAENPAWHVPDSDWAGDLRGQVIPPDDPRNPIEARWMGIYDGAGIHGTTAEGSIGTAASHGCIRMRIPEVIELYDRVNTGTPVYIA
jgi:lipoprotein-anchoring transpeptidase ErfK/SrfK